MILLGNLLSGLAQILDLALGLVVILIIARAVVSWVNADPYNPIVRFIHSSTDPILQPLQRVLPLRVGMVDFSPMLAILVLYFLKAFLVGSLFDYAQYFRVLGRGG